MFADYFSDHARSYAECRPRYPDALFAWLSAQTARHEIALDCATGNGQAAVGLADHYRSVIAIDASPQQLAHALPHGRVEYRVAHAERTGLAAGSADIVTVAQALHWLALPEFFAEASRVLSPGGLLAVWGYGLPRIAPAIDAQIDHFYTRVVGGWWSPQRRLVDDEYRNLSFPLKELPCPRFAIEQRLDLATLIGYVRTWSATRRLAESTGQDSTVRLAADLRSAWGHPDEMRFARWPVFMRAGRP